MISTLIIEDEKPAARKLQRMLQDFPHLEIQAVLHSVEEAVRWLIQHPEPKLIFSDIVLGDGLSFDIFDQVKLKSFIIYTTAFDQYTLRAFKLNSIDYLLKPIDEEELRMAIAKFQTFIPDEKPYSAQEVRSILKSESNILSRILVKIGHQLKIVYVKDICCFYSENKIVYLQTMERSYPTDYTLEELEGVLETQKFFRVNRQFIIHLDYIKNIQTSPVYKVTLERQPDQEITISRDRISDFKKWLS
ncbi:LytTR family DNA-binding domain-containing protein [Elizabethkingia sp. JS20170427COW]|uniref:LytR/AlgR family response regulator transcription factor n=1 Tax=Elizabethkingia sp. JS20170427COW TaxID=2583851 RepID=UPI0011109F01|nr:LytTR family DNA-binding domain-containing protein [Elizabethkingia sp. JS20170427COW]QCX54476.1 response regulator transcription factor [Elizabethkingia sp. JS20170427COW]